MPVLLRQITISRWKLDLESSGAWLEEGEIPADPVTELKTTSNCLSVWEVGDDDSLIARLAAALTVQRRYLKPFDYVLFDSELVGKTGIEMERVEGGTHDKDLNARHIDLRALSAQRLVRLVERILSAGVDQFDRANVKEVGRFILEGVLAGRLTASVVSDEISEQLNKFFGQEWRDLKPDVM